MRIYTKLRRAIILKENRNETGLLSGSKGKPFFNDIRRALPNINSRTLTTRLKEFEENHIVTRTVINTQPIQVSYELTEIGEGVYELLLPLLFFFSGERYKLDQKENQIKSE